MNNLNLEEFGKRIISLREKSGKSQEEISANLGITQQTLSRYEKGQRQASLDFVVRAAQYFNVSADYLLGLSDVKSLDKDIQIACEVTGLSENAINKLSLLKENFLENNKVRAGNKGLNHLFESNHFISFANQLFDVYLMYRDEEADIWDDICCTGISSSPISEIEKDVEKAIDLISLIGYKAVNKKQYFELCLQNAYYSLKEAFKDWLDEIEEHDDYYE